MLFILCVVICTLLGRGSPTVIDTAKEATASCRIINNEENAVRIDFRLVLNSDPNNRLIALDYDKFTLPVVEYEPVGCTIPYNAASKSYHVQTTRDQTTDGINRNSNLCGLVEINEPGTAWLYRLTFLHQTGDYTDLLETRDRVYIVDCMSSNAKENVVRSNIQVSRPVQTPVVIQNRVPVLSIWKQVSPTGSQYQQLTTTDNTVEIGTNLKLRLSFTYGTFDVTRYYGCAGMRTLVSSNPSFNGATEFFDNRGCSTGSLSPQQGFVLANDGSSQDVGERVFYQETGAFPIWVWDTTPMIYIRVYYDLCHGSVGFNNDQLCRNPCSHNSRRRREIDGEFNSTTIMIQVYDPAKTGDNEPFEGDSNGMMIGIVVACVVACALVCVLLVAIVCFMKRRSSSEKKEKYPNQGFENSAHLKN